MFNNKFVLIHLREGNDEGWLQFGIVFSILFLANSLFAKSYFSINKWDWARDVGCEVLFKWSLMKTFWTHTWAGGNHSKCPPAPPPLSGLPAEGRVTSLRTIRPQTVKICIQRGHRQGCKSCCALYIRWVVEGWRGWWWKAVVESPGNGNFSFLTFPLRKYCKKLLACYLQGLGKKGKVGMQGSAIIPEKGRGGSYRLYPLCWAWLTEWVSGRPEVWMPPLCPGACSLLFSAAPHLTSFQTPPKTHVFRSPQPPCPTFCSPVVLLVCVLT